MSDKPKTPPIEPQSFVAGVKVVDIGDVRVARGMSRRPFSACPHSHIVYDCQERRIWCEDCETDIEGFDAFRLLVEQFAQASAALDRRRAELDKAELPLLRSIAAKKMDEAWRSRTMVPACPHCGNGLFPEDFKTEPAMLGREYAAARLKREKGKP